MIRNSNDRVGAYRSDPAKNESRRVGVIKWREEDGIARIICDELKNLGYTPIPFHASRPIPDSVSFLFSFGPYGDFLQIPHQLLHLRRDRRPLLIQWNTEGLPDLRIPPFMVRLISKFWTSLDSRTNSTEAQWFARRMLRFRYVGDYYSALASGSLDLFADSSAIYSSWHQRQGLPTVYAPWGATARWYRNLQLERDIDVLWMGNRESRRRDRLLTRVHRELVARGVKVYLADSKTNPFIFDETRTRFLNRSKITLNLLRTWYDDNYSRFALAASNRSLLVSEPLLPHCPESLSGVHYVSAPVEELADTIIHYLQNDDEREQIAANAYELVTTKLKFGNSIGKIMATADELMTRAGRLP